jgi:phosphoglycerate dehydrogenase-like enzyme
MPETAKRVKVVIYGTMKDKHLSTVHAACPTAELVVASTEEAALAAISDATALCLPLDHSGSLAPVLAAGTQLEWLHCFFAGVESLLTPAIVASPIVLTNAAGVHAPPIAETVIGMMLAFARALPTFQRQQQERVWFRNVPVDEIAGRTCGIVGLGGIGRLVAKKAKALDMRVIGTKHRAGPVEHVDEVLPDDQLHSMLAQSDYVVVAVPSTPETIGLIGQPELLRMKTSAYLINVARGNVIDQAALITALRDGQIAGAGLDVMDPEPLPADNPLWTLPNVILTPHCSARSPRLGERTVQMFADNLARFAAGQPLLNIVDKQRGY